MYFFFFFSLPLIVWNLFVPTMKLFMYHLLFTWIYIFFNLDNMMCTSVSFVNLFLVWSFLKKSNSQINEIGGLSVVLTCNYLTDFLFHYPSFISSHLLSGSYDSSTIFLLTKLSYVDISTLCIFIYMFFMFMYTLVVTCSLALYCVWLCVYILKNNCKKNNNKVSFLQKTYIWRF